MFSPPKVGDVAESRHIVAEEDLSREFGNAGVQVLASPRLQHWVEATIASGFWAGRHDAGETLLGTEFYFKHLAPSPLGAEVTIRVEVAEIQGRRARYTVTASDQAGPVSEGWTGTYLMETPRFDQRLAERTRRITAGAHSPA